MHKLYSEYFNADCIKQVIWHHEEQMNDALIVYGGTRVCPIFNSSSITDILTMLRLVFLCLKTERKKEK